MALKNGSEIARKVHKKILKAPEAIFKNPEKILDTSEKILKSPEQLLKNLEKKRLERWFDKFEFFDIFMIWAVIVILFGIVYFAFKTNTTYLYSNIHDLPVNSLLDTIYFSFITATTTGFGDIVPLGAFKIVAMFEVIFGLILLAFVTSKLVSIKQDIILGEIYEISFKERVNRLRASLLVIRQHLIRMTAKAEDDAISRREINDIYTNLDSLENILKEIAELVQKDGDKTFTKTLDKVDAEVIFTSVLSTFERLAELIETLDHKKIAWKGEGNISCLKMCVEETDALFEKLGDTKISKTTLLELSEQKNQISQRIKSRIKE